MVVRDAEIADGRGWFELRQERIDKRTSGDADGPIAVRVREAKSRLRVDIAGEPDAFEQMIVLRVDGRTVVVTLTKPVVPPVTTTPPATEPETTTREPEPEPEPEPGPDPRPPLKTG